ncbi:gluconokinase [Phenylobacterium sp.]|jgi:carbohydrate kinase (thermoresistant glucokinase family)|uniref:gluconokinase n=1 Tax=Phenylobacterium sp. TaxID=1871053 RepID=UPI002E35B441|nr:gluconokinase [Phenylobacterium sp.]HEX3367637.1 gluconokinase [Phenylobacterium sp.]
MTAGPPPLSPAPATVLVVMGVSGAGKTTVGEALARRLGWTFQEGDDFHPAANIAKMKAGHPLDDADRAPWLAKVEAWIANQLAAGRSGVIACSALKRSYRSAIVGGRDDVILVYLEGDQALIAQRIAKRHGHFMPPSLLASQFAALQEPAPAEHAILVDIDQPVNAQVDDILDALRRRAPIA